jgi:hypothetical protein
MPRHRLRVCFSGTVAIMSDSPANAIAGEKPPTVTTPRRTSPSFPSASSTGLVSSPRLEISTCAADA